MINTGLQFDTFANGTIVTRLGNGKTAYGVNDPGVLLTVGPAAATSLASALMSSPGSSDWAAAKRQMVDRPA
jgi:hypothetical protein